MKSIGMKLCRPRAYSLKEWLDTWHIYTISNERLIENGMGDNIEGVDMQAWFYLLPFLFSSIDWHDIVVGGRECRVKSCFFLSR